MYTGFILGEKLSNFDLLGVLEDEELFGNLSDENAVRVCLLLALELVFMGRLLAEQVDDKLRRLVEDLEAWNSFPWGEHIWRQLYKQILDVVSRHRWKHLKGLEASLKYVPMYTLSRFFWAFKIWILESFERSNNWWKKHPDVIPRGVAWSKKEVFTRSDYGLLFGKDSKIHFDLKATLVEQQPDWYTQSQEFIMGYIPKTRKRRAPDEYDVYLQKLDADRKRGRIEKKYLPLVPSIEATSLITEIGLKDRVIQELNSRVFKLESVIQVICAIK
ncbi:phospholipase-like protein [Artemisia annua]|uniref:Phospholipase-like protein n=1 Tax=Artemisia annua TaxID=35608 RepID=A0A2U1P8F7_ARTAN|nr:phospholipase-like protein [Artemisia annua]